MIAVKENSDFGIPHGLRKARFLASAAIGLGFMMMTALPPAAAQTFSFGGFRIHVSGLGMGGGHYYRHRSSRHHADSGSRHADSGSRRHGRRHGREEEHEVAEQPAPARQAPAVAPVASGVSVDAPVTRPVLQGPDTEPSK